MSRIKFLGVSIALGYLILAMQPVYAQEIQANASPVEILSRTPNTLYTEQLNPVAVEHILVQAPARRSATEFITGDTTGDVTNRVPVTFSVYRLAGHAGETQTPIYLLPDWTAAGEGLRASLDDLLALAAAFGADADVYFMEPRGMGDAGPDFACPGVVSVPLGRPVGREEFGRITAAYLEACLAWWTDAGVDMAAYTFTEMARDVVDTAQALGHDTIVLAGIGAGAFVARQATLLEGAPVERAILIRPPGFAVPLVSPAGLGAVLDELTPRAAVAPSLAGSVPDLEGLLAIVMDAFALSPVAVTVSDPVTGSPVVVSLGMDDLHMALGQALVQSEATAMPRRLYEMAQGDFRWLGEQTVARRTHSRYNLAAVAALCLAVQQGESLDAVRTEAAQAQLGWGPFQMVEEACVAFADFEVAADMAGLVTPDELPEEMPPMLYVVGDLDGRTDLSSLNALATAETEVEDFLLGNWTGRLDAEFYRQATGVLRAFVANSYEAIPLVETPLIFDAVPVRVFQLPNWQADYYANRNLSGDPVLTQVNEEIDFVWGTEAPNPALNADDFSARWTQQVELPAGTYRFYAWTDDGVRLWIDNVLVLDAWQEGPLRTYVVDVNLVQGLHDIRFEYFESGGNALARLRTAFVTEYADWQAAYYPNVELAGEPVVLRNEPAPNAFWGAASPAPGVPAGNFSGRWENEVDLAAGNYVFRVTANGGVRLFLGEEAVIDAWENVGRRLLEANRAVGESGLVPMRLEYFVVGGTAELSLQWQRMRASNDLAGGIAGPAGVITGPARGQTDAPLALAFEALPVEERAIESVLWDMGDAAQYTGQEIEHTYSSPGIYHVTVVFTDSAGLIAGVSRQMRIDREPVDADPTHRPAASITGPTVIDAGEIARFDGGDALGVNPIVRYEWEFGDGTRSDASLIDKVFHTPGLYNVRLRVQDDQGAAARASQLVLVLPTPAELVESLDVPAPDLDFAPDTDTTPPLPQDPDGPGAVIFGAVDGQAVLFDTGEEGELQTQLRMNQTIVLNARSSITEDTPNIRFEWDIADGFSTTQDPVIELVFAAPGLYRVRLMVTDEAGLRSSQLLEIEVVE